MDIGTGQFVSEICEAFLYLGFAAFVQFKYIFWRYLYGVCVRADIHVEKQHAIANKSIWSKEICKRAALDALQ